MSQDPGVFYARADSWQLPQTQTTVEATDEAQADTMPPYYVTTRLPGETSEEFALLSPFTPRDRQNMIGLFAARCDGDSYGEKILYRLPTSRTVYGPEQIGKRIRSDSKISPYLSLNDQKGSRRAVRIDADRAGGNKPALRPACVCQGADVGCRRVNPELKQVVVAFENRIAMEPTLPGALEDLFGVGGAETATPGAAPSGSPPAAPRHAFDSRVGSHAHPSGDGSIRSRAGGPPRR